VAITRYSSPTPATAEAPESTSYPSTILEEAMPRSNSTRIVLVTCGNLIEARRIASKVVRKRLAACATVILGPVQSIYRWKGKVQTSREQLVLIKTIEKRLPALEVEVKRLHSYDVPEFVAIPATYGSSEYLNWLAENSK
jgi:periplasmic divalent cation tolerance protein